MMLSISTIEIPLVFYNVSKAIQNTNFKFQEESDLPVIIDLPSKQYGLKRSSKGYSGRDNRVRRFSGKGREII